MPQRTIQTDWPVLTTASALSTVHPGMKDTF